jgi:hypothetical protein
VPRVVFRAEPAIPLTASHGSLHVRPKRKPRANNTEPIKAKTVPDKRKNEQKGGGGGGDIVIEVETERRDCKAQISRRGTVTSLNWKRKVESEETKRKEGEEEEEKKTHRSESLGGRAQPSSREATVSLSRERLEMALGSDLYDELSGSIETKLADMRDIVEWEREPLVLSSSTSTRGYISPAKNK